MVVGPLGCPSLIGRTDELRELIDRRLAAARGRGGLVFVSGDGGIGKSRLVRAFRNTLTGGRAQCGTGYCDQTDGLPYAPLIDALTCAGSAPELSPARSKDEQMAALSRAVANSCRQRNTVLVLEDLHWADAGTLSVLVHLLPLLDSLRLLVVATYRSDEIREDHIALPYLARLRRFASSIVLGPLRSDEMRRLLRGALGTRWTLRPHVLEEIIARAEGNPFFAEELLKNVLERGDERAMQSLPLTIRASVLERLAGLDEVTLAVMRCGAILGPTFALELLVPVCGYENDAVLAALRRLRDLQIIDEDDGHAGVFAFRHSLTHDVIYENMLAREARFVHEHALRILESAADERPHDLGYHAWMARDAHRCVLYNERAGDHAHVLHAHADAVRCYERALDGAASPEVRSRLLAKAAAASAGDGKSRRALELYAQAIENAGALGDAKRIAALQNLMAAQARLAGENERAATILTDALDRLGRSETLLRAELALNLALCKLDHADLDGADALIAGSAEAANTPLYWNTLRYAAALRGDIQGARAASARHITLCKPLGQEAVLRGRFNYGFISCVLGFDDEALTTFDAILPQIHALRLSSLDVLACANAALVHARRGNTPLATELIERGLAIPEPSTTGPIALAAAALAAGDEELIARAVSEEVAEAALHSGIDSTLGRFAGPYARWLYARGEQEESRALLERAVGLLHGPFATAETFIAAAELGNDEMLATVLSRFLIQAEALGHVPRYAAAVAHIRAIEARRRGDRSASAALSKEAEKLYHVLGWPLDAARCREPGSGGTATEQRVARAHVGPTASLSARETTIAKLVAVGTSNAAVAERLTLSRRTVEKHLTSIYAKLGLRNRAQLAAFMTRQGTISSS